MAPFRFERRAISMADLSPEALRVLITELNECADDLGCVVFRKEGHFDHVTVMFAGHLERFSMLSVTRYVEGPVIFVQDVKSGWYQGSDLVPELHEFCREFLVPEIGSCKATFFGQSSGGYAALVASTYVRGSSVLACAPQTFFDGEAKARFQFVGIRCLSTPDGMTDVRELLRTTEDERAFRAIVIAAGETGNPASSHYWMDYMHAMRMVGSPGTAVFIVNHDNHAIVHRNAEGFAEIVGLMHALKMLSFEQQIDFVQERLTDIFSL